MTDHVWTVHERVWSAWGAIAIDIKTSLVGRQFAIGQPASGDNAWSVVELPNNADPYGLLPPGGKWFASLDDAKRRRDELVQEADRSATPGSPTAVFSLQLWIDC